MEVAEEGAVLLGGSSSSDFRDCGTPPCIGE